MSQLLSICIPTYNHADLLRGCLEKLIPQVKEQNIQIYISDNASTDHTARIVNEFRVLYPNIHYSLSEKVCADKNVSTVIRKSRTRYVWLMGDRVRVADGAINKVLSILSENGPALLVLNSSARAGSIMVKDVRGPKLFKDPDQLLGELGWWMTFIGATIWSSDMVNEGQFQKYEGTEYGQVGTMFDYLAAHDPKVYWDNEPYTYSVGESGWLDRIFDIMGTKWIDLVMLLPERYSMASKLKCIKALGTKNKWFSFLGFLLLRSRGFYDLAIYRKHLNEFKYISNVPLWALYMIAITPQAPLKIVTLFKDLRHWIRSKQGL